MKTRNVGQILILIGLALLLTGCETDNEMLRSTAVSPMFPPAPPNPVNTPALRASGAAQ